MAEDSYIKILKTDTDSAKNYYQKFLSVKSEQQKFLEELLSKQNISPKVIADIACGSGTLTYHISKLYKDAKYILVDLNDEAIALAKENLKEIDVNFGVESIYDLKSIKSNSCDLVFCWQTLSWIEDIEQAIKELVRITKKGGGIYCSSLFNLDHDVDIYSKVYDYTKISTKEGLYVNYNVYSKFTISRCLDGIAEKFDITEFNPNVDFNYDGKGIGTYTIVDINNKRIQFSAGMHMPWGILKIIK